MDALNRITAAEYKTAPKHPVILVLENIRSMLNVGSIFRTSDAFRIEAIYLSGYTPQPPHREINKTALGATESVAWQYFSDTAAAIEHLRSMGYAVWALEQAEGSVSLEGFSWTGSEKIAFVLGNEAEGVLSETLTRCDACVEIPQFGIKHSLNISVAAGVLLWQLMHLTLHSTNSRSL